MSTFHRFCARLLRRYGSLVGLAENFTIYDTADSRQVLRAHARRAQGRRHAVHARGDRRGHQLGQEQPDHARELRSPGPGSPLGHVVAQVYPAYQARLLASSAVDFDDLLLHVATLLRDNPEIRAALDERYRYILVDEYQDTNLAQYTIVRALSIDDPNLAVTGDPDQSIYGWRGANLSNILDFEHDFPDVRVVRLERNYRSTKRILRVADALDPPQHPPQGPRSLYTENDEGQAVRLVAYATQTRRGRSHRRADCRRDPRRPPPPARLRHLLSRQRPVAQPGVRAARRRRSLPDGQRPGVLPAQGNQGHAGVLAPAQQPARRQRLCCA